MWHTHRTMSKEHTHPALCGTLTLHYVAHTHRTVQEHTHPAICPSTLNPHYVAHTHLHDHTSGTFSSIGHLLTPQSLPYNGHKHNLKYQQITVKSVKNLPSSKNHQNGIIFTNNRW